MGIGENIKRLRLASGMSQEDLGKALGVSGQAVGQWESGKRPSGANILKLLDFFTIDSSELIGEEQALYTSSTAAPVFGRIAAGTPIAALPVEDSMWVPPTVLRDHPRGFYLRVEGDSMSRRFPNGSLVFVDPEQEVCTGHIAALNINGCDATVKRVLIGSSSITLVPESWDPIYKDQVFDKEDPSSTTITLIGRVVWSTMPYESGL